MATKKPTDREHENTVAALDKLKQAHIAAEDSHGKLERAIETLREERDEARIERDSSISAHKAEVADLKAAHERAVTKLEAMYNEKLSRLQKVADIINSKHEIT